ncbi:hypothetical protein ACA910_011231 [Epithemia clementina (nom. ined.)]
MAHGESSFTLNHSSKDKNADNSDDNNNNNNILPFDVIYNPELNRLECRGANSCQGWTITDCTTVQCLGLHACQEATMQGHDEVSCDNEFACSQAHISHTPAIFCGGQGISAATLARHYCQAATLNTGEGGTVFCFGGGTCQQEKWSDRLSVTVGTQGRVVCNQFAGEEDDQGVACRHLVVHIPHASRACFSDGVSATDVLQRCAVNCIPEMSSCDPDSIQFIVAKDKKDAIQGEP